MRIVSSLLFALTSAVMADTLPTTVLIDGDGPPLVLNGSGVRRYFLRSINDVALYVAAPVRSWEQLVALPGRKRVQVRIRVPEFSAEQFRSSWRAHFEATLAAERQREMRPRIEQFLAAFDSARSGDTLWFDCLPGRGLRISIRGEPRTLVEGEDFCPTVYANWLGPQASTSQSLQAKLLAGPEPAAQR